MNRLGSTRIGPAKTMMIGGEMFKVCHSEKGKLPRLGSAARDRSIHTNSVEIVAIAYGGRLLVHIFGKCPSKNV
jgi:hypothetical protein